MRNSKFVVMKSMNPSTKIVKFKATPPPRQGTDPRTDQYVDILNMYLIIKSISYSLFPYIFQYGNMLNIVNIIKKITHCIFVLLMSFDII